MLAIVSAFQHWRHYLEGARHRVTVFTDHKNLEVFMSTKQLNCRQARWAELLAAYDFELVPIPGTKNPADGPSRRPDYAEDIPQPTGTLLPRSVFQLTPDSVSGSPSIQPPLRVDPIQSTPDSVSGPLSIQPPLRVDPIQPPPGSVPEFQSPSSVSGPLSIQPPLRVDPIPTPSATTGPSAEPSQLAEFQFSKTAPMKLATLQSVSTFSPEPNLWQRFIDELSSDTLAMSKKINPEPPFSWNDGLLLRSNLVYVPESLRLDVLRMHHDDPLAGHFGIAKTTELLSRNYWFPSLSAYVKNYVSTCDSCSRAKPSRHLKHGELLPLPVPSGPWKGITCDFITDLPSSHGYDALLVFVDRFSKMSHLVPCNKTTDAPAFAQLFVDHIVRLHGLPSL